MTLLSLLLWPAVATPQGPYRTPAATETLRRNECCGSMEPYIRKGQLYYTSPVLPNERLSGQIVDTGFATHLVTAENPRAVLTTGTNNRRSDGWTLRSKLRGVVRYIITPAPPPTK